MNELKANESDHLDHILESIKFHEFDKVIKDFMRRSATAKAVHANPSDKMIIALALQVDALVEGRRKWFTENPDKFAAAMQKVWKISTPLWHLTHPEESRDHLQRGLESAREVLRKWREENPEETRERGRRSANSLEKWRRENPEKRRANSKIGNEASVQKSAKRYAERFQIIKSFIPATGIRMCELEKLLPHWSHIQHLKLLRRAVRCGDLTRIATSYHDVRYYLSCSEQQQAA